MKRLTYSQVVATVFVLGWAFCPMVFAAERGKQEGKRVAREVATRLVGIERADSLMKQIRTMNAGDYTVDGDKITLNRPEGTYVFDQLAPNESGGISGFATAYDSEGMQNGEVNIVDVSVPDGNRIDFSVLKSGMDVVEHGSIVGVRGVPGKAVAFMGDDIRPSLVSFAEPTALAVRAISPLPTVTSLANADSSQGGVAFFILDDIIEILIVIFVVVVIVAVGCLAFGWFGCDGPFWWAGGSN